MTINKDFNSFINSIENPTRLGTWEDFFHKTVITFNGREWKAEQYNIFQMFLRNIFGAYKESHISTIKNQLKQEKLFSSTVGKANALFQKMNYHHPLAEEMLKAYKSGIRGWVMVRPKDELDINKPLEVELGAIIYKKPGNFKLHVSIDPNQMEQAIPIISRVLHGPEAPRLGFKMQTQALLEGGHQIGKELAIIFDERAESDAFYEEENAIQTCLNLLWKELYEAGIRPEPGLVLTPETMDAIRDAPEKTQLHEKENLEGGKFDRMIPCPNNCNFFFYRGEYYFPIINEADADPANNVYPVSELVRLARENPIYAHNPKGLPDPFLNIKIQG